MCDKRCHCHSRANSCSFHSLRTQLCGLRNLLIRLSYFGREIYSEKSLPSQAFSLNFSGGSFVSLYWCKFNASGLKSRQFHTSGEGDMASDCGALGGPWPGEHIMIKVIYD